MSSCLIVNDSGCDLWYLIRMQNTFTSVLESKVGEKCLLHDDWLSHILHVSVSQWIFSTLPSFQHMWNRKWKDVGLRIGCQAPFTQMKRQSYFFNCVFTWKRLKTEQYENRLEWSVSETPPHPLSCRRKVECFQQCWAHTMPEELSNSIWMSSRRPCVGFTRLPMTKVFSMFITATCWLGMHTTALPQIILDMSSPACKQNCFAMNLENVSM